MPKKTPCLLHWWDNKGQDHYYYFETRKRALETLKILKAQRIVKITHKGHQTRSVIFTATRCDICDKLIVSGKEKYTYLKKSVGKMHQPPHSIAHTKCADRIGAEHWGSI